MLISLSLAPLGPRDNLRTIFYLMIKGYPAGSNRSIAIAFMHKLQCPIPKRIRSPLPRLKHGLLSHFLRHDMCSSSILRLFHDKWVENFTCAKVRTGVNRDLPKVARACGGLTSRTL
ncbi:hypothetical protein TH1_06355 [Thalassospira lucentensis MCCC 1A00383 = DSM 14000]|nr:hypothetical protein TH1_06355 [Thalassospira lucentensis MCCC 1A00383 = DSM 14000]